MIRFLAFFFSVVILLVVAAMALIQRDKPSRHTPTDYPASTNSETGTPQSNETSMNQFNELTPAEARVIVNKGTEQPGIGEYTDTSTEGLYVCRQCNAPLYTSEHKFRSHCGWPAFDDQITDAVRREPDADGRRTEILCQNCDGHLGHVFEGEGMTSKNTRHCVNSISMKFYAKGEEPPKKIVLEEK